MARTNGGLFRATTEFAANVGGDMIVVHKDELVREGHPILKGREKLFEAFEPKVRFDTGVEQATAAPGERRNR